MSYSINKSSFVFTITDINESEIVSVINDLNLSKAKDAYGLDTNFLQLFLRYTKIL